MIQVTKVWWDGNKLMAEPIDPATVYKDNEVAQPDSTCSDTLRAQGKAYPRTCRKCGKGPCIALANAALDKKADNARDLGLDYEPDYKVTVVDDQHPNGVPLEQWGRVAEQGEDHMRQLIEDLISAMEYHVEQTRPIHSTTVALQAARKALRAQPAPVQEPVATLFGSLPVYDTPPVQEPVVYCDLENWLTGKVWADDVFSNIQHKGWSPLYNTTPAQPAPVQEPVAWMQDDGCHFSIWKDKYSTIPLYTIPPAAQRQWVGLTDEEFRDFASTLDYGTGGLIRAIEAKLKEKNT
jgi:hypothetical protein